MAYSKNKKIKITFNAPVTLLFTLISLVILGINILTHGQLASSFFTSAGGKNSPSPFDFSSIFSYLKLLLHIFGNKDFNQLISNTAFILLLGPMIEEKYGSGILALMMTVTSLVSGVVNACFASSLLIGASDIVFMMILLASFTSFSKNEIPLSFILILLLYIGREIYLRDYSAVSNISGGLCGSLFAFIAVPKSKAGLNQSTRKVTVRTKSTSSRKALENEDKKDNSSSENATIVGSIEL